MQIEDGSSNPLPLPQIKREKNRTMNQTLGIQKFIVQLGSLDAKKKKKKKAGSKFWTWGVERGSCWSLDWSLEK